jgi:isopropylmalate/homocitrate/citramalate synthase
MSGILGLSSAKTFSQWLKSNSNYLQIYKKLGSPQPFDVSLRDGLQSSKQTIETEKKLSLFINSCINYNPSAVEIGSLVSPKILPMLADSAELYKTARNISLVPLYMLVPSSSKLVQAIELGCNNISLITSVSEEFQLANTKKTLEQVRSDIKYITNNFDGKTKLYISCIDMCPLAGPIDHTHICDQILWYWSNCKIKNLCLSDTVGSLTPKSFVSIVDQLNSQGVPYNALSLHLHVSNELDVIEIMGCALARGIKGFDVSYLETGGCSVTMGKSKTKPNLSYPLYYYGLAKYIESINRNKN